MNTLGRRSDKRLQQAHRELGMRKTLWVIAGLTMAAPLAAQDRGLTATADALGGPRWQAHFERELPLMSLGQVQAWPLLGSMPPTLRLLGDYQFSALRLGDTGGLRLTGGLLINLRQTASTGAGVDAFSALPYSGFGYAGVGYAFGSRAGWGFSADLGLTALGFGNTSPERGTVGNLGLDNAAPRDFRPQPVIRLGVSMAF